MKRIVPAVFVAALVGLIFVQVSKRPETPARVVVADVLALTDDGDGWRTITVRFEDGRDVAVRTLAPFFFKPGYKAKVGIYERPLLPDQYDIVGDWTMDIQS